MLRLLALTAATATAFSLGGCGNAARNDAPVVVPVAAAPTAALAMPATPAAPEVESKAIELKPAEPTAAPALSSVPATSADQAEPAAAKTHPKSKKEGWFSEFDRIPDLLTMTAAQRSALDAAIVQRQQTMDASTDPAAAKVARGSERKKILDLLTLDQQRQWVGAAMVLWNEQKGQELTAAQRVAAVVIATAVVTPLIHDGDLVADPYATKVNTKENRRTIRARVDAEILNPPVK